MFGFGIVVYSLVMTLLLRNCLADSVLTKVLCGSFYSLTFMVYCSIFFGDPGIVLLESRPTSLKDFVDHEDLESKTAYDQSLEHDQLKASGYSGHPLELLLVRLLFCMFADDTGIFQPAQAFRGWLDERRKSKSISSRR